MDPLSITASLWTLLGACSAIGSVFDTVRGIRNVPNVLWSLNDEITDLRLTLLDIHERQEWFLSQNPNELGSQERRLFDRCHGLLEQTWTKVNEAEVLVKRSLSKVEQPHKIRHKPRTWVLVQENGRLAPLQVEIREARKHIQSLWGQIDRHYSAQIQVQLTSILETGTSVQNRLLKVIPSLLGNQRHMERKLDKLLDLDRVLSSPIQQGLHTNVFTSSSAITQDAQRLDIAVTRVPHKKGNNFHKACQCRQANKSFNYIHSFPGDLFLGYAATPMLTKHSPGCQFDFQADLVLVYSFPIWFLNYTLAIRSKYDTLLGLQCGLSVRPVLPYHHTAWKMIQMSDIEGLKGLLGSRHLPLEARDGMGNGLLHVSCAIHVNKIISDVAIKEAIHLGRIDVSAFLLKIGANPKAESHGGRTPYHDAWDRILYERSDDDCNSRLKGLFPDPDFDELYEFSALHRKILGLEDRTIDSASIKTVLNDGDRFGRSPLFWATWRGDQQMMEILLAQGACVNHLNHIGTSPLMLAAASANKAAMETLLRAGADAAPKNRLGATALHYVIQNSSHQQDTLQIMESLIDAGSDPNGQCIIGSPLCIAATYGTSEQVEFLINRGADQGIKEDEGHNPLSIAFQNNRHSMIRVLLKRGGDHLGSIVGSGTFMHLVAQHADTESLQILLDYTLEARDITIKNKEGLIPLELALQRDVDAEWREMFVQFLRQIDKNLPPQRREPNEPRASSLQWPLELPLPGKAKETTDDMGSETSSNYTVVDSASSDDEFVDALDRIEISGSSPP